jgi:outer membrane protein, heavy metal efflux system
MKFRSERVSAGRSAARPSHKSWRVSGAAALALFGMAASAHAQSGALTLEEALARAAAADPRLRAAEAGVEAAQAGVRQARVRPNPELGVEVENFGGESSARGLDNAETTFRLTQPLERGGMRPARVAAATHELDGARLDALIAGLDIVEEVRRAYYDALAAEALVQVAAERVETAQALHASVMRRVAAARDPLMAGARAEAGLAEARIAHEAAQRDAAIARADLVSLIGGGGEDMVLASAAFELAGEAPHAHEDIGRSPDLARAAAERERAEALARLERARGFQDPVVSLGVRRFEQDGETGLVAGVSVPLGIFDRNSGAIARARAEQRRAAHNVEAARRRIEREVFALERRLQSAASSVAALERDVLPQAERALALAREGYNQGAFSYLDVFEAQRALTGARQARIEALRTYHHTDAALDRLAARVASAETNP